MPATTIGSRAEAPDRCSWPSLTTPPGTSLLLVSTIPRTAEAISCSCATSAARRACPWPSTRISTASEATLTADAYWNGIWYNGFTWAQPYAGNGFYIGDPALGTHQAAGTIELRIAVGGVQIGAISGVVAGAPLIPTPTPTSVAILTPTPTPYVLPPGGGTGCLARSVTWDWELCVRQGVFDLFEIRVTALTEDALDSSFEVRVYAPGDFLGTDSFTKWPFYVGQTYRFDYGFDFFEYPPYPVGLYEVELRVDFLRETRVYVNVY